MAYSATGGTILGPSEAVDLFGKILNDGTTATTAINTIKVYVDNVEQPESSSISPPHSAGSYADFYIQIGPLSVGTHEIRIVTDVAGVIAESNESASDNEYTKIITVVADEGRLPNLTLGQPSKHRQPLEPHRHAVYRLCGFE